MNNHLNTIFNHFNISIYKLLLFFHFFKKTFIKKSSLLLMKKVLFLFKLEMKLKKKELNKVITKINCNKENLLKKIITSNLVLILLIEALKSYHY